MLIIIIYKTQFEQNPFLVLDCQSNDIAHN